MTHAPRPIDHCVLPTADLSVARKRLTALGFTVAPNGVHPFGTENCCVYFADGTFLEPIAVANAAAAAAASQDGNVFTVRDAAYRSRVGQEGFSALVLGTDDARRDHDDFVRSGISAGSILEFSRPFVDASGRSDTASFRLAFAADRRAPEALFFTCERVHAPAVDRSALQRHANGVRRIQAVVLEALDPSDFADVLGQVVGAAPTETSEGFRFAAANGDLLLRAAANARSGLNLAEIAFGVHDVDALEALITAADIEHTTRSGRLTVAPAAGQGATFAFEALITG